MQSGLYSVDEVKPMQIQSVEAADYYAKKEPGGRVVSKMKECTEEMERAQEALTKSIQSFVSAANSSEKELKSVSGKIRDGNDKLSASIQKFMASVNGSDFGKTVENARSLVDSLERLAALQDSGKLDKVFRAING